MKETKDQKFLSIEDARKIAKHYLEEQHYGSQAALSEVELKEDVYHLRGNLKMRSRSLLASYLYRKANDYSVLVQVHALEGQVLHYELT